VRLESREDDIDIVYTKRVSIWQALQVNNQIVVRLAVALVGCEAEGQDH